VTAEIVSTTRSAKGQGNPIAKARESDHGRLVPFASNLGTNLFFSALISSKLVNNPIGARASELALLNRSRLDFTQWHFELSPLPYNYDALEPYIDAQTMQLHHDMHHQTYVNNLNTAVGKYSELEAKVRKN